MRAGLLELLWKWWGERSRQGRRGRQNCAEMEARIEFVVPSRIAEYRDLAEDFLQHVLRLHWASLSDETTLADFEGVLSHAILLQRIQQVYGVDVSDIASGRLVEIFARIVDAEVHSLPFY